MSSCPLGHRCPPPYPVSTHSPLRRTGQRVLGQVGQVKNQQLHPDLLHCLLLPGRLQLLLFLGGRRWRNSLSPWFPLLTGLLGGRGDGSGRSPASGVTLAGTCPQPGSGLSSLPAAHLGFRLLARFFGGSLFPLGVSVPLGLGGWGWGQVLRRCLRLLPDLCLLSRFLLAALGRTLVFLLRHGQSEQSPLVRRPAAAVQGTPHSTVWGARVTPRWSGNRGPGTQQAPGWKCSSDPIPDTNSQPPRTCVPEHVTFPQPTWTASVPLSLASAAVPPPNRLEMVLPSSGGKKALALKGEPGSELPLDPRSPHKSTPPTPL